MECVTLISSTSKILEPLEALDSVSDRRDALCTHYRVCRNMEILAYQAPITVKATDLQCFTVTREKCSFLAYPLQKCKPAFLFSTQRAQTTKACAEIETSTNQKSDEQVLQNPNFEGAFSPKGMSVEEFFSRSVGEWRSQRSSHNLIWTQFETVTSELKIETRPSNDSTIIELCEQHHVAPEDLTLSFYMSWEGESDWDETEVMSGSTVMSLLKDGPNHGRLLRSRGYAEDTPAVGTWEMTEDGVFVLQTLYDAAAAEERIWFATPDLRMRVSQIRTSSGKGVVTASLSSEIRKLKMA